MACLTNPMDGEINPNLWPVKLFLPETQFARTGRQTYTCPNCVLAKFKFENDAIFQLSLVSKKERKMFQLVISPRLALDRCMATKVIARKIVVKPFHVTILRKLILTFHFNKTTHCFGNDL